jgi:hypothetical protein
LDRHKTRDGDRRLLTKSVENCELAKDGARACCKRILAERGIAIAIPQMDVHVRGAPSFNANAPQGAH